MKKLVFTVFAVLTALFSNAQDILIMQDGDEIKTKIVDVTDSQVKYRLFDDLEGPIYIVNRADAFMIKYENGSKDILNKRERVDGPKTAEVDEAAKNVRGKGFLFRPEVSGVFVFNELLSDNLDKANAQCLDLSFNVVYQPHSKISYGAGVAYDHTSCLGDFLPVYINVRGYFLDRKITPYYDVRLGYAFCIKDKMTGIDRSGYDGYAICESGDFYLRGGIGMDVKNFSFGLNFGLVNVKMNKCIHYDYLGIVEVKSYQKYGFFVGVNIGYNIR